MNASVLTLVRGLVRRRAQCPRCGSSLVRPSRESYEGWLAARWQLAPYRCRECNRHFAVPAGVAAPVATPEAHRDDTHAGHHGNPPLPIRCPHCGVAAAEISAQPVLELVDRFLGRRRYRCKPCRRHFLAARPLDVIASILLALIVLAGLVFAAYQARDLAGKAMAPKVRRWTPPR